MIEKNMKTVGFRDMHPMQVDALTDFIAMAVDLAAMAESEEVLESVNEAADDLVKIFGGNGVQIHLSVEI